MQLPDYVQIEPVGQCNLRCRMCAVQFRDTGQPDSPPAFMAFETFASLLAQFPSAGHLHLQGLGEPMLHPRIFDMVRAAKSRGMRVTTNTNLTVLDAVACIDSGLDELHGSLDGASATTYEYIRPRARFPRVLENLSRLIDARARAARAQPRIGLVLVVMRQNLDELPDWVELGHRLGVDSLFVQHLCHDFGEEALPMRYAPMRDFISKQMIGEADIGRAGRCFAKARESADRHGLPLRLPNLGRRPYPPGTAGRDRCDWPWRSAYVSHTGEAMPCCMISTPDRLNFGNMARDGVMKIWDSADYHAFRDRLEGGDPHPLCRGCSLYRGTF